jgi:transcriptional regulator with XRE-family HTH domain
MYKNLKTEMKRKGITEKEIALKIGMAKETFSRKLNRKQNFWLEEAKAIQQNYFPESDFLYLFQNCEQGG